MNLNVLVFRNFFLSWKTIFILKQIFSLFKDILKRFYLPFFFSFNILDALLSYLADYYYFADLKLYIFIIQKRKQNIKTEIASNYIFRKLKLEIFDNFPWAFLCFCQNQKYERVYFFFWKTESNELI